MGLFLTLIKTVWRVLLRRLTGKGKHPSWSFPYEVGVEMCGAGFIGGIDRPSTAGGQRAGESVTPIPPPLRRRLRFEEGTLAGLPTEVHTPRDYDATTGGTLLYIHGGGYIVCAPRTHRALIARLADAGGVRTVAIDYRKAPEHPFPAGIDDGVAAYHALLEQGVDPAKLVLAGDSAGGGLVLAVLQRVREEGAVLPAAAVLLSPWVDVADSSGSIVDNDRYDYLPTESMEGWTQAYLAGADPGSPLVSPIHADLSGMPPMRVLTGTLELLHDQNVAFVKRALEQGVDVTHELGPNEVHVYPLLADVSPFAARAVVGIGEFIRGHVARA